MFFVMQPFATEELELPYREQSTFFMRMPCPQSPMRGNSCCDLIVVGFFSARLDPEVEWLHSLLSRGTRAAD